MVYKKVFETFSNLSAVRHLLLRIAHLIEYLPYMLQRTSREKENLASFHKSVSDALARSKAIALIVPSIVSWPSTALYTPKSGRIPLTAIPSYAILNLESSCQTKQKCGVQHRGTLHANLLMCWYQSGAIRLKEGIFYGIPRRQH